MRIGVYCRLSRPHVGDSKEFLPWLANLPNFAGIPEKGVPDDDNHALDAGCLCGLISGLWIRLFSDGPNGDGYGLGTRYG